MLESVDLLGFVSRASHQTRAFGAKLGEGANPGDVILLRGALGAGKTTLVQGLAAGLQVQGLATSPSFTLINQYEGRLPIYHVDLFRLERLDLEMEQAIQDCVDGDGITVIEWPDLLPADLQQGALRIDLEVLGDDDRSIIVHVKDSRWKSAALAAIMQSVLRNPDEGGTSE